MTRKQRRLTFVITGLSVLGIAAALVLTALEDNLVFFYSPTDISERDITESQRFRLGGLVAEGSVAHVGETVRFAVTDTANTVNVTYTGILPSLFREGQGVVAEGYLRAGVFDAQEVLAKHDENYMPPEVADALKRQGVWQHGIDAAEDAYAGETGAGKAAP